jgi:hypothetical protein
MQKVYFVYLKIYSWIYYDSQMCILNVYEWPYYICIQGLSLILLNGFNIMVTQSVYFEYIKVLCKIFTKYNVTVLLFYPIYLITKKI